MAAPPSITPADAPGEPQHSSITKSTIDVEQLADALMTDRFIKIYVGTREVPYFVSQVALCSTSDYFVKAIKNERMGQDNIGVLRFPEDDEHAWKVLLFYIVRGTMPQIEQFPGCEACTKKQRYGKVQATLMDLWVMGDIYLMPKLQNAVMMMLLDALDNEMIVFTSGVQCLRDHTASSVLGRVVCQSLVESTYGGYASYKPKDLEVLDGVPGAIVAIAEAVKSFASESFLTELGTRQWPVRTGHSGIWKDFMVTE